MKFGISKLDNVKPDIPEYLKQSDKPILRKFKHIQNQEDERLREATMEPGSRWSLGVSILPQNDKRNRYVNIMPYERNRVKLNTINGNDYINASYIKIDVPNQSLRPGYYIAAQGPTKNTWQQFWQMCYQKCPHNDIVIVMVTPLMENGREKCYPYWPTDDTEVTIPKLQSPGGKSDTTEFPSELRLKYEDSIRVQDYYTLTTLSLGPIHGTTKRVHHFYFDQWRDMSKPQEILPIMSLCDHSHRVNSEGNPIIVHCSAGVGRSGTFITLDHLIHDTADFELLSSQTSRSPRPDYSHDLIEQIVSQLRLQRLKMVQMPEQFMFIYHAARYLYNMANE